MNIKHHLKNKIIISLLIILAIGIIFSVILFSRQHENTVCFEKKCFKVEQALTPEERERGLMQRTSLDENKGMLFVFEQEDIYGFWMKNTYIPLDMIWINEQNEVVFIYKNALPCKEICDPIVPYFKAKYVLEINANLTDKYDIHIGSDVKIK
jgi:uncharacterized membrane protein (UPF0127 family)